MVFARRVEYCFIEGLSTSTFHGLSSRHTRIMPIAVVNRRFVHARRFARAPRYALSPNATLRRL